MKRKENNSMYVYNESEFEWNISYACRANCDHYVCVQMYYLLYCVLNVIC